MNGPRRLRAEPRHVEAMRAQLHDAVDQVCDYWPHLERMATLQATALPSALGGAGGSSGHGPADPTGGYASTVDGIRRWLREAIRARQTMIGLAGEAERLIRRELPPAERPNLAETCGLCRQPMGRIRRIDGIGYCAETEADRPWTEHGSRREWEPRQCYWAALRSMRRAGDQAEVGG